ncbi:CU044_2847 family protein [Saccharopolyspora sp. NPDC050389]|uniref:CU044_2847 family protein n=1 Tax=Saccharopolyspora sp. NPDC050389 TaxID=3155516 RepID=UPI0033CE0F68
MAQLVKMPLDDGGELLIETVDGQGSIPVGGAGKVVQASETVQKAMGSIRSAAEAVLGELRAMEQPPSKVDVQFGIKVTGEATPATTSRCRTARRPRRDPVDHVRASGDHVRRDQEARAQDAAALAEPDEAEWSGSAAKPFGRLFLNHFSGPTDSIPFDPEQWFHDLRRISDREFAEQEEPLLPKGVDHARPCDG